MKIVNFGSVNIDIVFDVDNIVLPGQTIASSAFSLYCGGKGANQSVAVAQTNLIPIYHAGLIGSDGLWIKKKLEAFGVHTDFVFEIEEPSGQAFIQVAKNGQNSIVLYSGANKKFTKQFVDTVFANFKKNDWLMIQNETNLLPYIIEKAKEKGLNICFNPAPFDKSVLDLPLHLIDLLSVNETEAQSLCGSDKIDEILVTLKERYPKTAVLLTLGKRGAIWSKGEQMFSYGNYNVPVVDTTGAGDTFIGYFLAAMVSGKSNYDSLKLASMAANVAITKKGAMDSIPRIEELSLLDLYGYIEF